MERVIAFVNTRDVDDGTDELNSAEQLQRWLVTQGLLERNAPVSAEDVTQAVRLREGLRAALLAHDGHSDGPVAGFEAADVPLRLVIAPDGSVTLAPAGEGVTAALAQIVAGIPQAVADGSWERTKACPKDTCQWAFYDRSKNRSRRWCSMEVCGNQEKSRSFRERQRGED